MTVSFISEPPQRLGPSKFEESHMEWRPGRRHRKAFVTSQSLVDPIPGGLVQPALVATRGDARYEKFVVLIERMLKIICERVGC